MDSWTHTYSKLECEAEILSKKCGLIMLILSGFFSGLGNSLEPVSMLSFLQVALLVAGLENVTARGILNITTLLRILAFVLLTQAFGFGVGFSGIFGYPKTLLTLLETFAAGCLGWLLLILFAITPHILIGKKYPNSSLVVLVLPILHTSVSCSLIGGVFSVFPVLGNAMLDYEPLRQAACLLGIVGVHFIVVLSATSLGLFACRPQIRAQARILIYLAILLVSLFVFTGFYTQADSFYQKDVRLEIKPSISVSCIPSQSAPLNSEGWNHTWTGIQNRIYEGDSIILLSEAALHITSDKEEVQVLEKARQIAATTFRDVAYIGLSYFKKKPNESFGTIHFSLITSEEDMVAWNYRKAHPVPLVESFILAGPPLLPIYDSSFGRLAGSICFDMDFPQYILQAGRKQADIMLQPTWGWGAISIRHFNGDSVRTIENGFTLFRCSSNGVSGIVDPRGKVLQQQLGGRDPVNISVFTLPLRKSISTVYSSSGFLFEWILVLLTLFIIFLAFLPKKWLKFRCFK